MQIGAELGVRERLARDILRCRMDPFTFVSRAARTESGRPVRSSEVHRMWHQHLNEHPKVVLFAPVGHGKTFQITIWRLLWEIGRNPDIRIAVISSSERLPGKILSAIKAEVQLNPWLQAVFPHLRPAGVQKKWGDTAIAFERRSRAPDPTIQIFGPYGKILGSRIDLILFDDVCTMESTLGKWQRDKLFDWISGPVLTRLPNTGGRVWAIGNTWHADDALHRLARLRSFQVHRYSAFVPIEGGEAPLIPEMWTMETLREREETYGPIWAKQLLRNELVDAAAGRIRRDWFEVCLRRGRGYGLLPSFNPADAPTYTGVDLGVRKEGAVTCIFTVAVLPEGTRWLIDIRSGHWSAPEILRQLQDVHQRYGSIIAVENNSAQNFLLDFSAELTTLAIRGHNTVGRGDVGNNLHHPQFGVESLGLELHQGKWRIPCDNDLQPSPEVAEWIREAIGYTADGHMGDRLSASWICREAIRLSPAANIGRPTVDLSNLDTLTR